MPLLWLALAFLGGVLLAATVSLPTNTWLILAGAALLGAVLVVLLPRWLARRENIHPRWFLPSLPLKRLPYPFSPVFIVLLFVSVFLGASRYQATQPDLSNPGFIAWYNQIQGEVVIEGVISDLPDVRDTHTNLRVAVNKIRLAYDSTFLFRDVHGLLLVKAPLGYVWHYGDRVHLEGRVEPPPEFEGFSYREYLARQGIYSYMSWADARLLGRSQANPVWAVFYHFKEHALKALYRIFSDPEASLLAGILLGVETSIPQDVQDAFITTGTSHIIAISGKMAIVCFVLKSVSLSLITLYDRFMDFHHDS